MAGSYVSQLAEGKISPAEFVAKCAAWIKGNGLFARYSGWFIEAAERFLIAKGVPPFLAEIITNEIREALVDKPATPPAPS